MSYFSRNGDAVQRGGKVAPNVVWRATSERVSVVFFGLLAGVSAFVFLEARLIGVDYLVPHADDSPGSAVR